MPLKTKGPNREPGSYKVSLGVYNSSHLGPTVMTPEDREHRSAGQKARWEEVRKNKVDALYSKIAKLK